MWCWTWIAGKAKGQPRGNVNDKLPRGSVSLQKGQGLGDRGRQAALSSTDSSGFKKHHDSSEVPQLRTRGGGGPDSRAFPEESFPARTHDQQTLVQQPVRAVSD